MKNLYINSRLHPLLVETLHRSDLRQWLFSVGETWLLLTPGRLRLLADRVGVYDRRIMRLVGLLRRHSGNPERFCRRLGIPESHYIAPDDYPFALCPRCDGVHYPHPEEVGTVCPGCRAAEAAAERLRPGGGELRDRELDRMARERMFRHRPDAFHQGELAPNYKLNLKRRLCRDWDTATNRILMGRTYRDVAREFDCSVGLLHRMVKERKRKFWENN